MLNNGWSIIRDPQKNQPIHSHQFSTLKWYHSPTESTYPILHFCSCILDTSPYKISSWTCVLLVYSISHKTFLNSLVINQFPNTLCIRLFVSQLGMFIVRGVLDPC